MMKIYMIKMEKYAPICTKNSKYALCALKMCTKIKKFIHFFFFNQTSVYL